MPRLFLPRDGRIPAEREVELIDPLQRRDPQLLTCLSAAEQDTPVLAMEIHMAFQMTPSPAITKLHCANYERTGDTTRCTA